MCSPKVIYQWCQNTHAVQYVLVQMKNKLKELDLFVVLNGGPPLLGRACSVIEKYFKKFVHEHLTTIENDDNIKIAVRKHRVLRSLFSKQLNAITNLIETVAGVEEINTKAQFSRIDGDPKLSNEDKFQYLMQAAVSKSSTRAIVESCSPSRENYIKAICLLKEQFGCKDLLTILFSWVESCLPLETMQHWEQVNSDFDVYLKEQLDRLIVFFIREVQAEERVALSNASNTPCLKPNKRRRMFINKTDHYVTTSDLDNALNMSHDEKRTLHTQNTDNNSLLPDKDDSPFLPNSESDLLTVNHSLAASASNDVYLQTFVTILHNGDIRNRVLIDSISLRSYILGSLAGEMNYVYIGKEHQINDLFRGYSMGLLKHSCYKACMRELNSNFACKFSVLNQPVIATAIPLALPKEAFCVTCCSTNLITFTMKTVTTGDIIDLWKLETISISNPAEKISDMKRLSALEHLKKKLFDIVEKSEEDVRGHYLSHCLVLKDTSSTTKVWPVFDSSAKIGRYPSLNDYNKTVGVSADIEKAFLQIAVHPENRHYPKFLWWTADDELTTNIPMPFFVVTGSPFILTAVLDYHLSRCMEECSPGDVKPCNECRQISKAKKVQVLATKIMAQGGFNLRGWEFSGDTSEELTSTFGLKWNRKSDTLNVDWWEKVFGRKKLTINVADSMGKYSGLRYSIRWGLLGNLQGLAVSSTPAHQNNYQSAYWYIIETEEGEVMVNLVQSKSWVTPSKPATITRLALMGATIGACHLQSVRETIGWTTEPIFAWNDSSTVLAWIQHEEEWSVFIRNRIKEIR
ncbi:hypothetical protein PR048_027771 [Dryococelus australis]|uniref:Uncharacterized protein n=1 Tax=Dryococelus australis TaxID=614101 RepID=A0ABQ9GHE8_9NEOP|nr:hypothetical protein PR048_027771 [Dryococelus australis]